MQNRSKQNGKNQAEIANNIYPIKGSSVENNYTKVPNWLFDTGFEAVEQVVLMSIVRYTLGYHRKSAKISHATLCKHAHCAKPRLIKAISKLESEGCIQVFRSTENGAKSANSYSIINKTDEYINPDVVTTDYYPSNHRLLPLVTTDYYPSNAGLHNKENLKESNKENLKDIITATAQTDETTPTESQPELLPPASQSADSAASKAVTAKPKSPKQPAPTTPVWNAYVSAYQQRYGVEPIRGAKANSQLSTLVKTVGQDKATQLASYYLTHNKPIYASSRHSIDWLLRDCAALHTDMMTGTQSQGSASGYQRPQLAGLANANTVSNRPTVEKF